MRVLPDPVSKPFGRAREWAVAVRGFNVVASNKLNVRMDGRSLFTPFFSGVRWNAQGTEARVDAKCSRFTWTYTWRY